jgi:hypothetical protein
MPRQLEAAVDGDDTRRLRKQFASVTEGEFFACAEGMEKLIYSPEGAAKTRRLMAAFNAERPSRAEIYGALIQMAGQSMADMTMKERVTLSLYMAMTMVTVAATYATDAAVSKALGPR